MDAKTIIAIVLVVFIAGAAIWLNIRNRKNKCLLVGGQDIACRSLVVHLGNGVFANPQIFNEDFAVLVGGKGLVVVHARNRRASRPFSLYMEVRYAQSENHRGQGQSHSGKGRGSQKR